MTDRVSVIIPAYNAAATIGLCLGSLCSDQQQTRNLEIIVVDDASADETCALVEGYQAKTNGDAISLRLLRQPRNAGPAAARNRGAEAATGAVLLFTDSDCVPAANWVEEMTSAFADPQIAAVKGAYKTRQTELLARFAQAEFESRYRMLAKFEQVDVVFTYAAAFRQSVFSQMGGFDSGFPVADNEDTELSWRIVAAGHRIVFNPRAIVYHRHPATLRAYFAKKRSRGYWRIRVYRSFPGKAIRDTYTPQSLKAQVGLLLLFVLTLAASGLAPWTLYGSAACGLGFFATAVPFLWHLPRDDRFLQLSSPFLLVARAAALGMGVVSAIPLLFGAVPQSKAST